MPNILIDRDPKTHKPVGYVLREQRVLSFEDPKTEPLEVRVRVARLRLQVKGKDSLSIIQGALLHPALAPDVSRKFRVASLGRQHMGQYRDLHPDWQGLLDRYALAAPSHIPSPYPLEADDVEHRLTLALILAAEACAYFLDDSGPSLTKGDLSSTGDFVRSMLEEVSRFPEGGPWRTRWCELEFCVRALDARMSALFATDWTVMQRSAKPVSAAPAGLTELERDETRKLLASSYTAAESGVETIEAWRETWGFGEPT